MKKWIDKVLYWISPNSKMRFLNDRYLLLEKDMWIFASIVFNIETVMRIGKSLSSVKIPISEETCYKINIAELKNETERLLSFVLMKEIKIQFNIIKDSNKGKRDKDLSFKECKTICLFSGGVDSFSGIIKSKEEFKDIHGVNVAHADQSKGVYIVNNIRKQVLDKLKIPISIMYAPPMKRYGYSQLRGFLYCMYGAIYMSLKKSKNLLVTECGPTMYQSKFSPFDDVTMTTHPFVLARTKAIIELFLNRKINVITPYENLTKAEVIFQSPIKDLFNITHSCISLGTGRNCGHCYGCVVRRLGSIVANRKDADYDYDPILSDFTKSDNLISLLRFSHDILTSYATMNFTSKENVFIYKKQRLFRRFAIDNFAALYILKQKGLTTNPYADELYNSILKKIGDKKIKERIVQVKSGRFIPNFSKTV